jgi:hypothetical protein
LPSCIVTSFFIFWSLLEYINGIDALSRKKYINTDCVSYFYCGVNGGKRMMHDYKTQPYNLMVNQLYYSTKLERDLLGIKNKSDMLDIRIVATGSSLTQSKKKQGGGASCTCLSRPLLLERTIVWSLSFFQAPSMKQIPTIGGLPAVGLVAQLIRAKERLDRRVEAAAVLHQHKPNLSFISVIPTDGRSYFKGLLVYDMSIFKIHIHSYTTLWKLTDIT